MSVEPEFKKVLDEAKKEIWKVLETMKTMVEATSNFEELGATTGALGEHFREETRKFGLHCIVAHVVSQAAGVAPKSDHEALHKRQVELMEAGGDLPEGVVTEEDILSMFKKPAPATEEIATLSEKQYDEALEAMERYGGGFASGLAVAWRHADPLDRRALEEKFGTLLMEYVDWGKN